MTTVRQLLADRYRLDEQIAVGGMGQVWRATDTVLDRCVAVKMLKPEYVGESREQFRAKARAAARLSHPGIASVYDFGETLDGAWLVMELVDGEPLSTLLRRERALPADRVLEVVAQTAAALQAAHACGVVHRDVKPGNLLVRPDGVVKVTDFGIASAAGAVPLTQTGQIVGTTSYLSPEQAGGSGVGPASDLYSLGVVAYEALAGVRPFPDDHPLAVVPAHLQQAPPALPARVPAPVAALVMAMLSNNPADRPPSAAELAERATRLRVQGSPTVTRPAVTRPAVTRPTVPHGYGSGSAPGATPRGQRLAVRVITVVLALMAVALGLRGAAAGPDSPTAAPTTAASTAPSAAPARTTVSAASMVGKSAAAASQVLRDQSLVPRLVNDGRGSPVGTVAAVEPTGPVAVGSVVVLHVVPAPVTAPAPAAPVAPISPGGGATGQGEGPRT